MVKEEKKSNLEKGQINFRLYRFYVKVLRPYARLRYGLRIDNSKIRGMDGPFLLLGNHTAWVDVFYFCGCIYPRPLNCVITSNIFYHKQLGPMFRKYGAIPKKQFTSDFSCIKSIKRFLDNGVSVLLFPEGRITLDGTTGYISPAIGKLIKFLKVPVVSGITVGSYATRPKWGNTRPGRVKLTVEPILTVDEINKMSADEIFNVIKEKFTYNDGVSFEKTGERVYGLHLAESLEKILYKCPNCGAEYTNHSKGCKMVCEHCGNTIVYTKNGTLKPNSEKDKCYKYIGDWYKFERDETKREAEAENFEMIEEVELLKASEKDSEFLPSGMGVIKLNKDGITYIGYDRGNPLEKLFKLQTLPTVAYKLAQNIEIAEDELIYKFVFKNGMHTAKFVLTLEELYKLYIK